MKISRQLSSILFKNRKFNRMNNILDKKESDILKDLFSLFEGDRFEKALLLSSIKDSLNDLIKKADIHNSLCLAAVKQEGYPIKYIDVYSLSTFKTDIKPDGHVE